MRILLIEDEPLIGDGIKEGLPLLGFPVDWFTRGRQGELALEATKYDAVILDLTLPDIDGLKILQNWRSQGQNTPVLILTARNTIDQKIEGLDSGADDYLPKPFALEELAARLRALIRRNHQQISPELIHGELVFNQALREVTLKGELIPLSPKEVALLEYFLLNKNSVLSKTQIEENLYTWGEEVSSNAIEFHIHQLRRKLGAELIKTIRGIGYKLASTE